MKHRLFCVIALLSSHFTLAQNTSFLDNFESATSNIAVWRSGSDTLNNTYPLAFENGNLKIAYNRTATSKPWDAFNVKFTSPINASSSRFISIKIKSSFDFRLSLKPIYTDGNDWIQKPIKGNNNWNVYYFRLSDKASNSLNEVTFYFNGGSTNLESGSVYFDDFMAGDNVSIPVDKSSLVDGIRYAKKLLAFTVYGSKEGQYRLGTEKGVKNQIAISETELNKTGILQKQVDSLFAILNDSCMAFETKIKMKNVGLIDASATRQTKMLYANLKKISADNKFLYGSQDPTDYGVGWTNNGTDRSDIKDVSGSHPAVFGWDFSWIRNADRHNYYRKLVANANAQGAVQTFVWHQNDPTGKSFYQKDLDYQVVATILSGGANHIGYKATLRKLANLAKSFRDTTTGESIPLIFRPYHEHDGKWFWWGKGNCTADEYNALWKFTVNYLRDTLEVHNFIYSISPDGGQHNSKEEYISIYPGDNYVDILGFDFYFHNNESDYAKLTDRIVWLKENAIAHNKVAAVTEIGDESLDMANWHMKVLEGVRKIGFKFAYMVAWRNANTTHFYSPYKGHSSTPDFLKFADDEAVLLLNEMNGNINSKPIGKDFYKKGKEK